MTPDHTTPDLQDGPFSAYVRVSSEVDEPQMDESRMEEGREGREGENPSLAAQKDAIRSWVSEHGAGPGLPPVRMYEDATGGTVKESGLPESSASEISAPAGWTGLDRLLSKVKAGDVETILVHRANRLARTLEGLLTLTESLLEPDGVRLVSITEPLDTATEACSGFLRMLRSFPALARDRTTEGRRRKAESGGHASGEIPFGYRKSKDGKSKEGRSNGGDIEPDPDQAPVVRRIFELRGQGESLRSIAGVLNEEEVPTKRGGSWHASTIKSILDNPKYRGRIKHSFGDATVEAEAERLRIID